MQLMLEAEFLEHLTDRVIGKRKKMNSKLSYKIYNKCKHLYKITKVPAQIVYYDEVRVGKTRKKVVGNLPPLKLKNF